MLVHVLIQRLLDPFAWCISQVRVNRVTFETIDGQPHVRKQRSALGWILIVIGNVVFQMRYVPVKVLHPTEWVNWERCIQNATGVEFPELIASGLLTPQIPGRPLSDVVSNLRDEAAIIDLFAIALAELYHFHQIEVRIGTGGHRGHRDTVFFSHGDASISNVMFDDSTRTCCWFDFDLRHDLKQPEHLRRADDLRAFLFTAVQCLSAERSSEDSVKRMVSALKVSYPCVATWKSLATIMSSRWRVFDLFHRAQIMRMKIPQDQKKLRMLRLLRDVILS